MPLETMPKPRAQEGRISLARSHCLGEGPSEKVISISGDGGFLFSGMELETAVRLGVHVVHMIWIDGHYDMVLHLEVLDGTTDAVMIALGGQFTPLDHGVRPRKKARSSA